MKDCHGDEALILLTAVVQHQEYYYSVPVQRQNTILDIEWYKVGIALP